MIFASCTIPLSDSITKILVRDHDVIQVLWVRYAVLLVGTLLLILRRGGPSIVLTRRFPLHALRSLIAAASSLLFMSSLRFIPLADAIAIVFIGPLLGVALSVPMLGERVGPYRWAAVCVGFLGALVIMRPGLGIVHWASSLAALSALAWWLQQIMIRQLATTEHALSTLFWMAAISLVVIAPALPFTWTPLTATTATLMVLTGAIAMVVQICIVKSIEYAPISAIAPFSYFQITSAIVLGWFVFGDWPDVATWCGLVVVIASGLFVAYRERKLGDAPGAA